MAAPSRKKPERAAFVMVSTIFGFLPLVFVARNDCVFVERKLAVFRAHIAFIIVGNVVRAVEAVFSFIQASFLSVFLLFKFAEKVGARCIRVSVNGFGNVIQPICNAK